MRPLNWSAERDEEEDFELNIRAVSGGLGMIVLADGVTQDPNVTNFTPLASGGRNQLKVRGVGGWDAIKAYVQFGIRAPISPVLEDRAGRDRRAVACSPPRTASSATAEHNGLRAPNSLYPAACRSAGQCRRRADR